MTEVSLAEAVKLGAVDTDFFGKTFFPEAMRDKSPSFDKAIWASLENPLRRYVNLEVFRGGAKTTKCRVFTAKRIAYGISRTILYIGSNEGSAVRSVQWIRSRIEPRLGADGVRRATPYAQAFGLRPGKKWQEHEIEIIHSVDARPIWVLAVGISGTIRGINFDDYRPDLIVCDDLMTDENSQTEEQCEKIKELVFGALANSLTPASEEPNAKMVHLCTPMAPHDVSQTAKEHPLWTTETFGCWTEDTKDNPVEGQDSVWEERFPSAELRNQKMAALAVNRYSSFAREMECRLVSSERCAFRPEWLKFFDELPKGCSSVLVVDPVPPPSDAQIAKSMRGKDFESIAVVSRRGADFYVPEYVTSRGHDPNWTMSKVIELALRHRVQRIVVESVAYQRTLKWLLEKEMARRGIFWPVKDTGNDRRPKYTRITTALAGVASQGRLHVRRNQSELVLQFNSFGLGYRGPDDVLETIAIGVSELTNPMLELSDDDYDILDDNVPKLDFARVCP